MPRSRAKLALSPRYAPAWIAGDSGGAPGTTQTDAIGAWRGSGGSTLRMASREVRRETTRAVHTTAARNHTRAEAADER